MDATRYYRKAWEVIGYTYDADMHCLSCTRERFTGIADGNADEYRDSEGNTPHAVFVSDELDGGEVCGDCFERIE